MQHPLVGILTCAVCALGCATRLATPSPAQTVAANTHVDLPSIPVPNTPAGRLLSQWLATFNTGSLEAMEAFTANHFAAAALSERSSRQRAESDRWMYMNLGPMDIADIDASDEFTLTAAVYQNLVEGWGHVTVKVDAEAPHLLLSRRITFFEPPPSGLRVARGPTDAALEKTLERFLQKLVAADVFSGVVLVAKEGRAIFHRAYGLALKDPAVPNTVDTQFQLASVSKMFIAVAIAQLVERGQLSFQHSLAALLPSYPGRRSAEITVRHLLTHSSGLPDYFFSPKYAKLQGHLASPGDYWPMFATEPLRFEPGAKWEYSNSNYVLLASIIEQLTGQRWRDRVEEHVFRRARLRATTYREGTGPEARAIGFTRFGPGRQPDLRQSRPVHVPAGQLAGPAGGGMSSSGDLLRFANALLEGRLLKQEMVDLILRKQIVAEDGGGWALGFETREWNGVRFVGHNGFFDGAYNQVDIYPTLEYTVVVLSNTDMSGGGAVANKLRLLLSSNVAGDRD